MLHELVHHGRFVGQVNVVKGKDDAANYEEKTATSALFLLVGPLDTALGKAE